MSLGGRKGRGAERTWKARHRGESGGCDSEQALCRRLGWVGGRESVKMAAVVVAKCQSLTEQVVGDHFYSRRGRCVVGSAGVVVT